MSLARSPDTSFPSRGSIWSSHNRLIAIRPASPGGAMMN
jgi:hypothetical protein